MENPTPISKLNNFITTFSNYSRKKYWLTLISFVTIFLFVVFVLYIFIDAIVNPMDDYSYGVTSQEYDESCNIQGVAIRGELFTYGTETPEGSSDISTSEDIFYYISDAQERENIKAVLLEVDSYGGSPAAAEEIYELIKLSEKPVIAYVRGAGVSAAYYAISGADKIFSLKNSDIGGIGVTQSYLDNVAANQKDGLSFVELAVGKFKDSGVPDRALTQEERDLFMRDLTILHENFIKAVAEGRNLSVEHVRALADGSMMLGEQAKASGLIDEIGGYNEAVTYIENTYLEDAPNVCW